MAHEVNHGFDDTGMLKNIISLLYFIRYIMLLQYFIVKLILKFIILFQNIHIHFFLNIYYKK